MGMFDWFEPSGKHEDQFRCSRCGAPVTGLQTKAFDCYLGTIRMLDDGALEYRHSLSEEPDPTFKPLSDTCYAYVYSPCSLDSLWNEWRIHVRDGKVDEIVREVRE